MLKENKSEFDKSNLTIWHNAGYKGKGTTVVVLDDRGMPLKQDNVEVPLPQGHKEDGDHNTNVCSVIRQVAPECRIISMPWFDGVKKEIIDWIFEHKDEIDVINCSFHGVVGKDEFNRLKDLDIPIICASGNAGKEDGIPRPASYDWTIAIGAVSESNGNVTYYSNGGSELDSVAYTNIYIPNSKGSTFMFNGTSCASPMTCGKLVCYLSLRKEKKFPRLTREQIRQFIHDNSIDMYEKGRDFKSGYGLFTLPKEILDIKDEPISTPNPNQEVPKEPKDNDTMDLKKIMYTDDYNKYINFKLIYDSAKSHGNDVASNYAKDSMIELLEKYNLDVEDYIDDEIIPRPKPEEPIEPPTEEPKEPPKEEVKEMIIDISHHQLPSLIDYDKLSKQIKLAIIRTQYGSNTVDKHYKTHHAEFKKRGVPTAAYAWVRGMNIADMETEATDFYNRTKDLKPTFWFLDVEEESMKDMRNGIKAYVKKLRELGAKKIGVYIGHHLYEKFNLDMNDFDAIWIPHYGVNNGTVNSNPKFYCDIHQYTSVGRLDGYNSNLDLNRLLGNKDINYFTQPEEPQQPIPEKPKDYFNDDNGKWHEEFNNKLAALGIINGDGKGNVMPEEYIKRGEVNKIIVTMYNLIMSEVDKKIKGI